MERTDADIQQVFYLSTQTCKPVTTRSIIKTLFFSVLLCSAAFAVAAPVDPATGDAKPSNLEIAAAGYKLAFSDEFNGSSLDTEKWMYRTDSKCGSTQLPANVRLANGHLVLDLKKDKERVSGKPYTGGGVISKEVFQYGYYEASMKTPPGAGWHSAFWLAGDFIHGKKVHQELDVMEADSERLEYYTTVHNWLGEHVKFASRYFKSPDLSQEFHTFGCEFTPKEVKYYFDNKFVTAFDLTKKLKKKDGTPYDFVVGDHNIWLTCICINAVDINKLPATCEFDYVRFYKKD